MDRKDVTKEFSNTIHLHNCFQLASNWRKIQKIKCKMHANSAHSNNNHTKPYQITVNLCCNNFNSLDEQYFCYFHPSILDLFILFNFSIGQNIILLRTSFSLFIPLKFFLYCNFVFCCHFRMASANINILNFWFKTNTRPVRIFTCSIRLSARRANDSRLMGDGTTGGDDIMMRCAYTKYFLLKTSKRLEKQNDLSDSSRLVFLFGVPLTRIKCLLTALEIKREKNRKRLKVIWVFWIIGG